MWLVAFLIGLYVAIIAVGVTLMIKYLTGLKLAAIKTRILDALAVQSAGPNSMSL